MASSFSSSDFASSDFSSSGHGHGISSGSSNFPSSGSGSGSGSGPGPGGGGGMGGPGPGGGGGGGKPEQGDYILNWHFQYCATIFLQQEAQLKALEGMIKAELTKIKTDGEFVKALSGSHSHLTRLKNQDKDLRSILDSINHLSDLFATVAQRSAKRII